MPRRSDVYINSGDTVAATTEATLINPHLGTDRLRLTGRKKEAKCG
jgi:hypothetical protein